MNPQKQQQLQNRANDLRLQIEERGGDAAVVFEATHDPLQSARNEIDALQARLAELA